MERGDRNMRVASTFIMGIMVPYLALGGPELKNLPQYTKMCRCTGAVVVFEIQIRSLESGFRVIKWD
jgi:hypothetical protein